MKENMDIFSSPLEKQFRPLLWKHAHGWNRMEELQYVLEESCKPPVNLDFLLEHRSGFTCLMDVLNLPFLGLEKEQANFSTRQEAVQIARELWELLTTGPWWKMLSEDRSRELLLATSERNMNVLHAAACNGSVSLFKDVSGFCRTHLEPDQYKQMISTVGQYHQSVFISAAYSKNPQMLRAVKDECQRNGRLSKAEVGALLTPQQDGERTLLYVAAISGIDELYHTAAKICAEELSPEQYKNLLLSPYAGHSLVDSIITYGTPSMLVSTKKALLQHCTPDECRILFTQKNQKSKTPLALAKKRAEQEQLDGIPTGAASIRSLPEVVQAAINEVEKRIIS